MKYEFKKGDRVEVVDSDGKVNIPNGFITTVTRDVSNDYEYTYLRVIDKNGDEGDWHAFRFKHIGKGKVRKMPPVDKHLVLVDSCQNFVATKNSYKEAEDRAKEEGEAVTIYKMVEVAKVASKRVVTKVKGKSAKKK